MMENAAGEGAKEREVRASRWSLEEGGSEVHPQLHIDRGGSWGVSDAQLCQCF